jgi:hypothetical protein
MIYTVNRKPVPRARGDDITADFFADTFGKALQYCRLTPKS